MEASRLGACGRKGWSVSSFRGDKGRPEHISPMWRKKWAGQESTPAACRSWMRRARGPVAKQDIDIETCQLPRSLGELYRASQLGLESK